MNFTGTKKFDFKVALTLVVLVFCLFCGVLIARSGLFENSTAGAGLHFAAKCNGRCFE